MRFADHWSIAIVEAVRDLTPSIRELTLRPQEGATAYPSGAHLGVRVLVEGRQDLRRYSLVGEAPRDGCWRIAVKREEPGRGGSRYVASLPVGARLEFSPPDSFFQLSAAAADYLLVAGGIGITPILGMAMGLLRRGVPFRMAYAGRARGEMAYLDEVQAALGERLAVFAEDEGGRPDLRAEFARLSPGGEAYVCGPLGMLEAAKRAWAASGRRRSGLVFETFGSSGRFAAEPFTVRVPRLGVAVQVPASGTMLDALEAAGVGVLHDCRRGECGLCAMEVLAVDGPIDHRDVFFSDAQHAEGRRICVCVSRVAGGSITVDPAFRGDGGLAPGREARRGG